MAIGQAPGSRSGVASIALFEGWPSLTNDRAITITLTPGQVSHVIRETSSALGWTTTLSSVSDLGKSNSVLLELLKDKRCSPTLLRALIVLAAFPTDGSERALTDVARQVGISPGTAHRHATTWVGIGVLAQNPHSRRYRRLPLPDR